MTGRSSLWRSTSETPGQSLTQGTSKCKQPQMALDPSVLVFSDFFSGGPCVPGFYTVIATAWCQLMA
eukprot:scaffold318153_cov19-Tisochrysis_lutea.AAC.1